MVLPFGKKNVFKHVTYLTTTITIGSGTYPVGCKSCSFKFDHFGRNMINKYITDKKETKSQKSLCLYRIISTI